MVGASRRTALRSLTALVHRGIVSEGDVEEFLTLYSGALAMRGIVVGQFGFHAFAAQNDIPDGWPEAHTRYRDTDPARPFLEREPAGTPYVISKHLDPSIRRLPLYDALCRADLSDGLVLRFRTVFRNEIFLATYRRKGMRAISKDDAVLARLLYPHCAAALSAKTAVMAIEQEPIDPRDPQSDGHAHVSFPSLDLKLSARAKRTWVRKLGVGGADGWRRVERLVLRAAVDFFHGEPGARSSLVLPSLRAELVWVPPRAGETRRALVLFFDETPAPRVLSRAAAELLSPRQREVALLAATGNTDLKIAAALGLSRETVRSHLREACRRLNVSRRIELTAFLTAGRRG